MVDVLVDVARDVDHCAVEFAGGKLACNQLKHLLDLISHIIMIGLGLTKISLLNLHPLSRKLHLPLTLQINKHTFPLISLPHQKHNSIFHSKRYLIPFLIIDERNHMIYKNEI